MLDVEVISDPAAATTALDPIRARLLAALAKPASAAALAAEVGLPRQKVHYHLRTLAKHGLVREVGSRQWGGITERQLEATAKSYVVSPAAMGPLTTAPDQTTDRLSASYLIALAARAVREVGDLLRKAFACQQRLATLAIDTEIRFRSAAERAEFSRELTAAITRLVSQYHDAGAAGGRNHRLVVLAHPMLSEAAPAAPSASLQQVSPAAASKGANP